MGYGKEIDIRLDLDIGNDIWSDIRNDIRLDTDLDICEDSIRFLFRSYVLHLLFFILKIGRIKFKIWIRMWVLDRLWNDNLD